MNNDRRETVKEGILHAASRYLEGKGTPDAFMLRHEGKHSHSEYALGDLDGLADQIADAFVGGTEEQEGLHLALVRIGGEWHEICYRGEDGSLMVGPHRLDEGESAYEQGMFDGAEAACKADKGGARQ